MKALFFLLFALNTQLWAANNNNIDIKKLENQKAFIGQINQCINPSQFDQFIKKELSGLSLLKGVGGPNLPSRRVIKRLLDLLAPLFNTSIWG
jgi:hypothetical protein